MHLGAISKAGGDKGVQSKGLRWHQIEIEFGWASEKLVR